MNNVLLRPTLIQNAVKEVEKELFEKIFKPMKEKRSLDLSETVLIPLARRGIGILPIMNGNESEESQLRETLNEFKYCEEYSLLPSMDQLARCNNIVIFDDVCASGKGLCSYKQYLERLMESTGIFSSNSESNIETAAYIVKKGKKQILKPDYRSIESDGTEYYKNILRLYLVIASRGSILDPDHMFVKFSFAREEDFSEIWTKLGEIARSTNSDIVEDGIEFLHPSRKKIGFYVRKTKGMRLLQEKLDLPDFVTSIDIAKFRMVFNLRLHMEGSIKVTTASFEAVPIINPVISRQLFSVEKCFQDWCPSFRFCEKEIITAECCSNGRYVPQTEYLEKNYYHPRYDCIIGEIVKRFNDFFLDEIKKELEVEIQETRWFHQERIKSYWNQYRKVL